MSQNAIATLSLLSQKYKNFKEERTVSYSVVCTIKFQGTILGKLHMNEAWKALGADFFLAKQQQKEPFGPDFQLKKNKKFNRR